MTPVHSYNSTTDFELFSPWIPLSTSTRLATVLEEDNESEGEGSGSEVQKARRTTSTTRLNPLAPLYSPIAEPDSPPLSPRPRPLAHPRPRFQHYEERPDTPPSEERLEDSRRRLGVGLGVGLGGGGPQQQQQHHATSTKLTRYLLVSGLPPRATEAELRGLLIDHLTPSVVACATHLLTSQGSVILRFGDVRAVVPSMAAISSRGCQKLRMLTRGEVEETDPPPSFLSPSEACLTISLLTPIFHSPFSSPPQNPSIIPLLPSLLPHLTSLSGTIRRVRQWRGEERVIVVEFWEEEAAERVVRELDGVGLPGGGQGGLRGGEVRIAVEREPGVASTTTAAAAASWTSPSASVPFSLPLPPPPPSSQPSTSHDFHPRPRHQGQQAQRPLSNSAPRGAGSFISSFSGVGRLPPSISSTLDVKPDPYHHPQQQQRGHRSTFGDGSAQPQPPPHDHSSHAFSTPTPPPPRAPPTSSITAQSSTLGPQFGIYRDDPIPASNVVHFERIEAGQDVRTTLMVRNLPNRMGDEELRRFIEEAAGICYDFIYVRRDWTTDLGVGYSFVNFTSSSDLLRFCRKRIGTRWNLCGSDKLVVASYANIQGKQSLINHFRSSAVLDQPRARQPKLFVTSGPFKGQPEPFPACDDPMRRRRSRENALSKEGGLWTSAAVAGGEGKKPVFKVTRALGSLNI